LALLTVNSFASLLINCSAVLVLLAVVVDRLRYPLGSANWLDWYLILGQGRCIPQKEANLNQNRNFETLLRIKYVNTNNGYNLFLSSI